jgi:hypothetical protein
VLANELDNKLAEENSNTMTSSSDEMGLKRSKTSEDTKCRYQSAISFVGWKPRWKLGGVSDRTSIAKLTNANTLIYYNAWGPSHVGRRLTRGKSRIRL